MDVISCVTEFAEVGCAEEYEPNVLVHVEHTYDDSTVEVATEVATFVVDMIFLEDMMELAV